MTQIRLAAGEQEVVRKIFWQVTEQFCSKITTSVEITLQSSYTTDDMRILTYKKALSILGSI